MPMSLAFNTRKERQQAAQQLVAQNHLYTRALKTIRDACTYGELERLAGITDRVAFWAPYATDEDAARAELKRLALARLTATTH